MAVMKMTGAASRGAADWSQIDWQKARRTVRRLQVRIAKSVREGRWGKVKALQRLLTHSFSGKALAVKRVTEAKGKNTPGVDRVIWDTPGKRVRGIASLKRRGYTPQPLRRVYILKSNGKLRPLGIPAMQDRAMQALHLLALEPVAETTADPNSYGFRPYRAARDAAGQCFTVLSRRFSAGWVLDCDISACFDRIRPEWMLENIPMDKTLLRKWLDAGYMDGGTWHASEAGTPQGSPISPTLACMTLDGMETELRVHFGPKHRNRHTKVHLIRYADDFVITGASPEVLMEARKIIEDFLAERGLVLSEEKTCMRQIEEGFDFLGWNIRKYGGKLLIVPAAKNVAAFLRKIRAIVKGAASMTQAYVINRLNPVIRGWSEYHRNQVAKETFAAVDSAIWELLWRWACRRHPNKSRRWVKDKYFPREGARKWVFRTESTDKDGQQSTVQLLKAADTPIRRHRKIKADANPLDPVWDSYFAERRSQLTYRTGRPEKRPHTPAAMELVAPVTRGFAEA